MKSLFLLPNFYSSSYFKDNGVEYARSYAKWRCSNKSCRNTWFSAYTWISFKALKSNLELYISPPKSKEKVEKAFKGSILKEGEYFQQLCRKCNTKNNKIIYFANLEGGEGFDSQTPHRSELCQKCLSGHPCLHMENLLILGARDW
jgi:hypothetical protein